MKKRIIILSIMILAGIPLAFPQETKIILTPKPKPEPRINGTKIFGVRPGSPFSFSIAATGIKPMKYEVQNLPRGLKCDPETGQISGSLDRPGDYITTFRVTNKLGSAQREFKIVCGDNLALTPHMGWNSWYVWENHVTDKIMREAAAHGVEQLVCMGESCNGQNYA